MSTIPPTSSSPETQAADPSEGLAPRLFLAVALLLFALGVLRYGWVSDDAFITARTLDRFFLGHGLVINDGHRVQSFTSPLGLLLSLPFFGLTSSPYAAMLLPGLFASFGLAVLIATWKDIRVPLRALALLALTVSQRFLEFSTSGLENGIAHLLLGLLFANEFRTDSPRSRHLRFLFMAALVLTRIDYGLLVLPLLVREVRRQGASPRQFAWFFAPLALWFSFSLVYYGFLFPNTAYAKLNTSIPLGQKLAQGVSYFVDAAYRDPWLLLLVFAPLGLPLRRLGATTRLFLLGSSLYLAYVLAIGGDFMSGRFLTISALVGVLSLVEALQKSASLRVEYVAIPLAFVTFLLFQDRRADRTRTECFVPPSGVVDERECYVEHTGLSQNVRAEKWKNHGYLAEYKKVSEATASDVMPFDLVGMATFGARTNKYILERYALSEPFLARLRFAPRGGWRPGHLPRVIPAEYRKSLELGRNELSDPCQRRLYDELDLVTTGPLFSLQRFKAIVSLNTLHRTCPMPR